MPFKNPERLTERVFLPKFLRKFVFRKLVANRRPNYICKTKFHCSPCAETPLNLSKYVLCRPTKLVANRRPDCICKTDFHCSPWAGTSLSLPKYVLCRPTKTAKAPFQSFLFVHKILFTAVLLMQNCKRTEDWIKSAKPSFTVRPSLRPTFSFPPCQRA